MVNGGFDTDLTGWGSYQTTWNSDDANSDVNSGSAEVVRNILNTSTNVPVAPETDYQLSFATKNVDGVGQKLWQVNWFDGDNVGIAG